MAKVRHLLHGIVRLNMRGTSPERFLNLCTLAGLNVWQVKKEQANLLFYMEIRDFKRCAPLARKAGVRLHIVEKRWAAGVLWRNRNGKVGGQLRPFFSVICFWHNLSGRSTGAETGVIPKAS